MVEDPDSLLSKAQLMITVVSSKEGDAGDAINNVKMAYQDKLEEWFGLNRGREMEVGIVSVNIVLHDRRGDPTGSSQEVNLIDGDYEEKGSTFSQVKPPLSEEEKRILYNQAKKLYPSAYNKVLEINSGNGSIAERS